MARPEIGLAQPSNTVTEVIQASICPPCLTPTMKLIIVVGIVLVMMHAHEHNVVYGSLCPDCVLLDDAHHPIKYDFGSPPRLSLSTKTNISTYTPLEARPIDRLSTKADVFAFMLMLYEAISDYPNALQM
jgi:hypothetical protein